MCWGAGVGVEIKDKVSSWPFLMDLICKNSIEIFSEHVDRVVFGYCL